MLIMFCPVMTQISGIQPFCMKKSDIDLIFVPLICKFYLFLIYWFLKTIFVGKAFLEMQKSRGFNKAISRFLHQFLFSSRYSMGQEKFF